MPEDKIKPINQWELEPKMEDVRPKDSPRHRGKNNHRRNRNKNPITKVENLLDIPVELLLHLLALLDVRSLGRLAQTCRRLRQLCHDDVLWTQLLRSHFPVTCPPFDRSLSFSHWLKIPDNFQLARVSHNWVTGTFEARRVVSYRRKEIARLRITNDSPHPPYQRLYSSHGCVIEMRRRPKEFRYETVFRGFETDVTDFVISGERLIGVSRDGSLGTWLVDDEQRRFTRDERDDSANWRGKKKTHNVSTRYMNCLMNGAHEGDIHAVVAKNDLCVTGSRDTLVKLWRLNDVPVEDVDDDALYRVDGGGSGVIDELRIIPVDDRVWSLALSPDGAALISGTAGLNGVPPLRLWDVESGRLLDILGGIEAAAKAKNGAGILHLHFESPHLLVSAGYDTFLRVWDLRTTENCVLQMEDPLDNTVYCACSSSPDTSSPIIATGTARHAVVNVWDRRRCNAPLRMIYANQWEQKSGASSPVYSLAMDWDRLYAAYDIGVSVLDFGVYRMTKCNARSGHSRQDRIQNSGSATPRIKENSSMLQEMMDRKSFD